MRGLSHSPPWAHPGRVPSLGVVMRAAFFDLDRTVIPGSSGAVVTHRLRDAGVVDAPRVPGESLLYRVYASMGENLPSMVLARQGVGVLRGIARHRLLAAAHEAIDELLASVLPGAREAIDRHRRNGDRVVLATSTPHDLIAAFARRVGFDDVIATRFAVDADDHYTGELDGPFTWSAGKLAAVRAWCDVHDVDLAQSSAYSDSYYDTPLLEAVAHPHAVNPDIRLSAMAASRNWPIVTFNDLDPYEAPSGGYREVQRAGMRLLRPEMVPFARFDIGALDALSGDETPIVVVEERSRFDAVALAIVLARSGRTARFCGPRDLFDVPVIGWLASLLGGIAVENPNDEASLEVAARSLEEGEVVVLVIRQDQDAGFATAAQLSAMTQAPVVPLALSGTTSVWPRDRVMPFIGAVDNPPTVTARCGRAVRVDITRSIEENASRIAGALRDAQASAA